MKIKRQLLLLIAAICMTFASTAETHRIYNVVVMHPGDTPIIISETSTGGNSLSGFNFKENYLRDADGKEIKFNNFLPMIGYFQEQGWIFPDLEQQILNNQSNAVAGRTAFLIYKEVDETEWHQWIERGRKKDKKK